MMKVSRVAAAAVAAAAGISVLAAGVGRAATTPHLAAPDPVSAGRYLVNFGSCNDCHTAGQMQGQPLPAESGRLQGSSIGFMGPWGVSYPPNLRLVLSKMSRAQWHALIKNPGPVGKPPMPWTSLQSLSTADQDAIYAYIRSLRPAGTATPPDVPPGQQPSTPYISFAPQNLGGQMPGGHMSGPQMQVSPTPHMQMPGPRIPGSPMPGMATPGPR